MEVCGTRRAQGNYVHPAAAAMLVQRPNASRVRGAGPARKPVVGESMDGPASHESAGIVTVSVPPSLVLMWIVVHPFRTTWIFETTYVRLEALVTG